MTSKKIDLGYSKRTFDPSQPYICIRLMHGHSDNVYRSVYNSWHGWYRDFIEAEADLEDTVSRFAICTIFDEPDEVNRWPYTAEGLEAAQAALAKEHCEYWADVEHGTIRCEEYFLEFSALDLSWLDDDDEIPTWENARFFSCEEYDYEPADAYLEYRSLYCADDENE